MTELDDLPAGCASDVGSHPTPNPAPDFARGLRNGLLLVVPFWTLVGALVWRVTAR